MMMIKKKRSIQRVATALGCALVLGCTFVLPSCGGGGGGSSPSTPSTPRPTVRNVILQTSFSDLPPFEPEQVVWYEPFVTSTTGNLDITVDWTFASNDIDVFLARGTAEQAESTACQEMTDECPIELVAQVATLSKPEVLNITGLPAGNYLVVVVNFGTTNESGIIVVGLTS